MLMVCNVKLKRGIVYIYNNFFFFFFVNLRYLSTLKQRNWIENNWKNVAGLSIWFCTGFSYAFSSVQKYIIDLEEAIHWSGGPITGDDEIGSEATFNWYLTREGYD